eukprot:393769_1
MGNSKSGPKNKLKVVFGIRNFAIHGLPQKPNEWSQRIDERMWNEFVTCVRMGATLDTAEDSKIEYKKWYCNFWIGLALFMIGIMCAIGMGLGGGLSGNIPLWVFAIIIGIFGVFGGMILFIISANKYGEINKQYISDVKSNVNSQLMQLNNKYINIIQFTVLGTANNIFKSKEDADTTININIQIQIFTQSVQYIPNQNTVIQQQPTMQLQAAQPQGQIIMVQMPDGRMVPAQIQGQVAAPQQQIIYQQPIQQSQSQQQQQVVVIPQPQPHSNGYQPVQPISSVPTYHDVSAPGTGQVEPQTISAPSAPEQPAYNPAYNPGSNIEEINYEEGGEGGKPTNGGFGYQ